MSPAALALSAALAVALDGPANDNGGSPGEVSGGRFTGMKRLRKRYGHSRATGAAPLSVPAIAERIPKGVSADRRSRVLWYVDSLPGEGGVDWGYTGSSSKARTLTPYWQRRFAATMRHLGEGVVFIPVGPK